MDNASKAINAALFGLIDSLNRFAQQAGVPRLELGELVRVDERTRPAVDMARRLSAGERREPGSPAEGRSPLQLLKIFCDLTPRERIAGKLVEIPPPPAAYWPLAELSLDETVLFAGPDPQPDARARLQSLWSQLIQQVEQARAAAALQGADADTFLENLLLIAQRFTWCLPSGVYDGRANISLYDHARMTAALTAVLTGIDGGSSLSPDDPSGEVALLVGGDLSGVQDFLYTISSRGATPALRGRSFYLQLLTEAVARYILQQLELPVTNLIYAGGGNFYLLARPDQAARLQTIQADVSRILLTHHTGSLYLAVQPQPLHADDFYDGNLGRCWGALIERLGRAKNRRFVELGDELKQFFELQGHGGNREEQCQVCGVEHPNTEPDQKARTIDDPEGVRKCPTCRSFEELGDDLRRARYLVYSFLKIQPGRKALFAESPGRWEAILAELGLRVRPAEDLRGLPDTNDRTLVLALKDDALPVLAPDPRRAVGRRMLVNVTPLLSAEEAAKFTVDRQPGQNIREGDIKPFDVMEAQAVGIQRLGVLRMDVDNMGSLFSSGLGPKATLARIASLSSTFNLFFEGWVGVLAERRNAAGRTDKEHGERLYSIYSGGDDLFFVGAWDEVVELGREIRIDLRRFAGNHPGIHASAGIALVGGKYPLAQAAQDAGRAEEQAKDLSWWDDGSNGTRSKDAVTFLGQSLPWERFGLGAPGGAGLGDAYALMNWLSEKGKEKERNPLIRRLGSLYARYAEAQRKRREAGRDRTRDGRPQALFGPWNWLSFYSLSRMHRQTKDEDVRSLRDELKTSDFQQIDWIGLAARWAELKMR